MVLLSAPYAVISDMLIAIRCKKGLPKTYIPSFTNLLSAPPFKPVGGKEEAVKLIQGVTGYNHPPIPTVGMTTGAQFARIKSVL